MSKNPVVIEVNKLISKDTDVSFEEIKNQLVKDLELAGISFLPTEVENIDGLCLWMSDICMYLIEKDFQSYLNLLYRIDVAAEKFIALNESESEFNSNEIAAILVIKREIEKIKLRKMYS